MERLPISGLRFRIAAALAVILALFIVITEVSISKLTRMAMKQHAQAAETQAPEAASAMERDLQRLRRPVLFYLVTGAVLALILASFAVNRLVVRPLHRLSDALEKVSEGRLDTTIPVSGAREPAEIGRAFNRMTAELRGQQEELNKRMTRIEQSAMELKAAQDQLIRSAKLASVGTLAAGVAHEIGNPLTGLLGLAETLEAGVDKTDEAKFLSLMKSEILRIDRIIRELLSYARAPGGDTSMPQQANLFDVFDNVRSLLCAQSLFDRIEWVDPERNNSLVLAISPDDLTQVLLNLFLNAAEAMKGKGRIAVDLEPIADWKKMPDMTSVPALKIHIKDTGPGISDTDAACIFDPFYTTSEPGKGCGLGLSVCQNLCERAGGDLGLNRIYSGGAQFTVILPLYTSIKTTV